MELEKMRILFVSANPGSEYKLDLADELRNFQERLKGHQVSLALRPAAQPVDLTTAIESDDYEIIHFSGHAKDDGILMRNYHGRPEIVGGRMLRDLFKKSEGKTRLAFLNACDTKNVAEWLTGTAEELRNTNEWLQSTVGMVIGTNAKLDDEAAGAMTDLFYAALGKRKSLQDAFTEATNELRNNEFPAEQVAVYEVFGEKDKDNTLLAGKEILLPGEKTDNSSVEIEGLPTWDKHYHVTHLDEQISSLNDQIKLNQQLFGGMLIAGVILLALLIIHAEPNWNTLFPFFTTKAGFPFITTEGREMLIGKTPLLEWFATLGAGLPVAIAAFKNRVLISGNRNLMALKRLRSMVRSSDKMSPATQKKLHNIMEQSVLGANSS